MDRTYENQRTVSATMLDTISDDIGRAGLMHMVEQELIDSVQQSAALNGDLVDIPMVMWTCTVTGRTRQERGGGVSQVTGQ